MLKITGLCYSYKTPCSSSLILDNIDLDVNESESILFFGPNGSGKSTLANIIAGLVKPDKGIISYDNPALGHKKNDSTLKIGYLFQKFAVQVIGATVIDDIRLSIKNDRIGADFISGKVKNIIAMLKLDKIKDRKINDLSGGELKKTALAALLASDPDIYLLDEPFSMLDEETIITLKDILTNKKKKNRSIIMFSHQLDALNIVDRVVVIRKGRIEKSLTGIDLNRDKIIVRS